MEQIKLLIAASKSIPENMIRKALNQFSNLAAESIAFVENGSPVRNSALEIWPAATPVAVSSSLVSSQKAVRGCTHIILMWDGTDLCRILFESRIQKKRLKLIPIQVTKVVNKRDTDDYDMYIGRGSPWGNPFAISHDDGPDRTEVIEKYRELFSQKIETDEQFKRGVLGMKGLRLACFCKPAPCHGDVIADYLNSDNDI